MVRESFTVRLAEERRHRRSSFMTTAGHLSQTAADADHLNPDIIHPERDGAVGSITLAGVRIDRLDFNSAVRAIIDHAASNGEPRYVVTPNAHHVVLHQKDAFFREIY